MKKAISMLLVVCLILSIFPMGTVYAVGEESERAPEAETVVVEDVETQDETNAALRNGNPADDTLEETDPEEPTDPIDPTEPTEPEEPTPPEVTRAQWVQCLVTAFNMTILEQNAPDNYYSDLDGTEDYYRDILVATAFGIIDIDAGLPFYPDEAATREFAAQTMNACLRYHLEDTEYTFAEAESVSYPGDIQTAVNHGWFLLDDENRFFPEQALTEAEQAILLAIIATELEAEEIDPNYESVYEYADGVIEVPDGTEVTVGDDTITITDCPVQIATGSTFVVYCKSFPQAYLAESVRIVNGITTITASRVNQNDVIVAIDAQGIIDMDFSDIPQDEENSIVFIDEVTGVEYTNGAECERAVALHPNMRGAKGGSKSISWKQEITLADGVKVNVSFKLKDPVYKYKLDTKNGIVCAYVDGDYTVSCGASMSSIPSGASDIKIGNGIPFLYICELALYLHLDAKGSATWNGSGHMKVGIDYSRTDGLKDPFSYEADGFYLEAKVSGKIGLQLRVGLNSIVGEVVEGYVYGEIGGAVTIKQKTYEGDVTPKQCTDAAIYAYLEAGAKVKIKFPFHSAFTAEYNHKIWDEKNSPARVYKHYEDGVQVTSCTHGEASGNGYYTGAGSNYSGSGYGDGSGGSAYGIGPNGELVLLYTYTLDSNNNATITGYTGNSSSLSLPNSIDGYQVIAIGNQAFYNNTNIQYVYIPEGITSIGSNAFYNCTSLRNVSIPYSVNLINYSAFAYCSSLTDIRIPGSGVSIGSGAFYYCSALETVYISDSALFPYSYNYSPAKTSVFGGDDVVLIITKDTGIIGDNYLYANQYQDSGAQNGIKRIIISEGITEIGKNAFALRGGYNLSYCTVQEIVLPSSVIKIGQAAFSYNQAKSIVLPDGDPSVVTEIGESAFQHCNNLQTISIPEGVETISKYCFQDCPVLSGITLPSTLTEVGYSAFSDCAQLTNIILPNGVTSIGGYAFLNCTNLSNIPLPDTVTDIGSQAFSNCESLISIIISGSNVSIGASAFSNCTSLRTVSLPDSTIFPNSYNYAPAKTSVFYGDSIVMTITKDSGIIPANFMYANQYQDSGIQNGIQKIIVAEGITEIGNYAFALRGNYNLSNCTVQEIVLPSSVTTIGQYAFWYNQMSNITLPIGDPDIAKEIGKYAFQSCSNLKSVCVPEGIVTLNQWVFNGCSSLEDVTLPSTLTTIGEGAFASCTNMAEIVLPRGITTLGNSAFSNCTSLNSIEFPAGITVIPSYCFQSCTSLNDVFIPNSIEDIRPSAFADCTGLQTISVANTTMFASGETDTRYTYSAFYGCTVSLLVRASDDVIVSKWLYNRTSGIQSIVIEEGILTIGANAFYSSKASKELTTVVLPESLIDLGAYAFYDCAGLQTVNLPAKLTVINDYAFYGCSALRFISIHDRIMRFGSHVFDGAGLEAAVIPSSVTEMGAYDFANCTNLTSVTLPVARKKIEDYTFYNCSALTSITLPRLVDTVGVSAFQGCSSLIEINWSERITTLGNSSFRGCAALQNIVVPETVTSIGTYAFADCTTLTDITLPENTISLANYLFSGCTALHTYELPANVTAIGDGVFSECSSLENVILPESLQSLGQKAFYNCDALQSIVIPAGTKNFGAQCFYDCDALQSLTLPNSVTSIGTYFCYSCDNLSAITLSEGMTTVPEAAFMDCSALNNVIVPRRVTTINSNAFNVCPSLTWILIPASATTIAGNALSYPDRTVIYGRSGSYAETYADEYGYEFIVYEVNATDVTLSESTLSIPRGRTATLIATVNPVDYTDDVTWKSTNTSVVTVSDDGVVTAVGVGTATVRMVVGNVSASCRVTVIEPVTRITLNKTTLSLDARESTTLSATVTPNAATIKTVQWTSSNETVATVDENGVVTAIGKGTATVTATAEDGTGIYATCAVTVTGNYIIAESIDELQSPHPYENSSKDYWSYTVNDAAKLYVTFSELTTVEEESDYLYIYDGNGNLIGTYTGEALAGQTIEVPGDTVVIKLVSDNSYSEYGFSVTAVGMEEPPHEHTFGEWELTKEPSCTETGIETRICTVCGENENREVEALGHDYVETVFAPSCVVQGYTLHTCSRCADSYKDSYTDPLGHSFVQGICERCGVADPNYENAALVISGGPITALPGDTVTVSVMVAGGARFAGFTLSITTSDGLTLKNIEKGELLSESEGSLTKNIAQGKVNWTDTAETIGEGELLLLTIELSETAGAEETITIRLKDNKSTNMVDINGQAVTTRFEDIVISTQTVLYGDTNSDGDIDTSDAVRLVRFLVDLVELTDLQKQAADVTHDNDITSADSIKLVRYLVGMVDTLSSLPTRGIHRAIEAGEINTANVTGEAGETVSVPVTISDNPGFAGFTMEIGYPEELQLISITKGAVLEESDTGSFTVNVAKNLVNWNDTTNTVENGELFILTFRIADDAESGQFDISISPKDNKVGNLATEEGQAIAASYVSGEVQISAINPFAPCSNSGHCPGIAFEDMPAVGNWAHDAIDWAVSTGVTVGTSETTFSPKKDCSRAEVVTFLWRAAGSPEPTTTECIFEDVKDGAYYEKAIIWAVENGITRGTSDTTFSPDKACSRAEVVTFLWRANGSPEVEGKCTFTDVAPGSYYEKAVIWAEQAGVTAGVSEDLFGTTNTCTRAQIVTFLFRNTVR